MAATLPRPRARRSPGFGATLLRLPLFYKILVANAAIVVLGAVAGTAATARFIRSDPGELPVGLMILLALVGVVITVLVNAWILNLALSPLKLLEGTAARVQAGDLEARVARSALADRKLERLTHTFNAMLDQLAASGQRLREVAARALNAEEEERKRIARELHDETAQTLAALLIRLRLARAAEDPSVRERILEEMRDEIGEALEGVRRFARGLRPPALDELGLVAALESHVRGLEESVGLEVSMEADALDGLLPPHAELALYRIVQESLSNVMRHAATCAVHIRLMRVDGLVRATVEDGGHGFNVREVMSSDTHTGLGLFGMQERAVYVGGRVTIESSPGAGTRVTAEVPTAGVVPPLKRA